MMHHRRGLVALLLGALLLGCSSASGPAAEGGPAWRTVALGYWHTCAIGADGKTRCWGDAQRGVLGDAHAADSACVSNGFRTACRATPRRIDVDPGFATLAAGFFDACGITADGNAYCWGSGREGLLGPGRDSSAVPVPLQVSSPIRTISFGFSFACALSALGNALCWGANDHGQLGSGAVASAGVPRPIADPLHFTSVTTGDTHACGLAADGTAHCWGDNSYGQLGIGSADGAPHPSAVAVGGGKRFTALAAGGYRTCGLVASGDAWCWGNVTNYITHDDTVARSAPALVPGGRKLVSIGLNNDVACGLTSGGAAYCWGGGILLGQGEEYVSPSPEPKAVIGDHRFKSLIVGRYHVCGIATNGEMWCWGWAHDGQLSQTGFPVKCFGSDDIYSCTGTPVLVKTE